MRFVDPKNDAAFRKIFGSENHKIVLVSFLNSVLGLDGHRAIEDITFLNPIQAPLLPELKETTLDIKARDRRGVTFIVEMQLERRPGIEKRVVYYTAKAYVSQILSGEDYPKLNQVIFVGILDFNIFEGSSYLTRHLILNRETQRNDLKDLEFNFIELPKFNKTESELANLVEKWVYFLKNAPDLAVVPDHTDEVGLREAYDLAERFNWTQRELEAYDYRAMMRQDVRGSIQLALEQGRSQGLDQGIERGRMQEAADKTILILETRFGALPADIELAVRGLNTKEALDASARHAVTAPSLEQFRAAIARV